MKTGLFLFFAAKLSDSFSLCNFFFCIFNIYIFIRLTVTLNSTIAYLTLASVIVFGSFNLVSLHLLVGSDRNPTNMQLQVRKGPKSNIFQENSILIFSDRKKKITFNQIFLKTKPINL